MVKKSGQPTTSGSPSDARHKPELHEPVKSDDHTLNALLSVSSIINIMGVVFLPEVVVVADDNSLAPPGRNSLISLILTINFK